MFQGVWVIVKGSFKDLGLGINRFLERRRYWTREELESIVDKGDKCSRVKSIQTDKTKIEYFEPKTPEK